MTTFFSRTILLALITLISFGTLAKGQNNHTVSQIREAVARNEWSKAQSLVESLKKADPNAFLSGEYDYLLGRLFEKQSRQGEAVGHFAVAASSDYALSDYALWHLARLARTSGDLILEREHLRKLIGTAKSPLLLDPARLRLTESFFESGDYAGAAGAARSLGGAKNVALAREGSLLLGRAYLKSGKTSEARDVFNRLVMQMPDASRPDDFALAAVRELDALQNSAPPLSEADHLLRASVYHFNRDFAGARPHYQAVVDANTQPGIVANALYLLGRGYYSETKFDDAIKLFERVWDQYQQTTTARDALGYLAASQLRLKHIDDAVASYKLLISRFPDGPGADRAYLNLIDALHEGGRYPEALNWVQQTRAKFKNAPGSALALFAQLRIHLAQGAWVDVIKDTDELTKLPDLGGTRVPGGTTPAEVNFLKAFALEQLGRNEEAANLYLAITDGRNEYYGERSTERLHSLAGDARSSQVIANKFRNFAAAAKSANSAGRFDEARVAAQNAIRLTRDQSVRAELIGILKRAYENLPNYKLPALKLVPLVNNTPTTSGERLFAMGLFDEAMPELLTGRSTATNQTQTTSTAFNDEGYSIAFYSLLGAIPNRAVRFAESLWKPLPADYVLEAAPRPLVELLYPVPFRPSLLKHAPPRNIDPRFALSIIRQESRYQVDVKSVAAARGMMQFIPSTANEIAAQLKLDAFVQDDLYDADTAILFGSQYLANLFQQFPDQPQAVAGSYNGGADNLTRWINRSRAREADRYVPEIGFSQTKDYVYKVMTSYWTYQRLYDNQLNPITK